MNKPHKCPYDPSSECFQDNCLGCPVAFDGATDEAMDMEDEPEDL